MEKSAEINKESITSKKYQLKSDLVTIKSELVKKTKENEDGKERNLNLADENRKKQTLAAEKKYTENNAANKKEKDDLEKKAKSVLKNCGTKIKCVGSYNTEKARYTK